jgi:hypothetical protein
VAQRSFGLGRQLDVGARAEAKQPKRAMQARAPERRADLGGADVARVREDLSGREQLVAVRIVNHRVGDAHRAVLAVDLLTLVDRARRQRAGDGERLHDRAGFEAVADRAIAPRGRLGTTGRIGIEGRVVREREDLSSLRIHHHHVAGARLDGTHAQLELALRDDLDLTVERERQVVPLRALTVGELLREEHPTARIEDGRHLVGRAAQPGFERALEPLDALAAVVGEAEYVRRAAQVRVKAARLLARGHTLAEQTELRDGLRLGRRDAALDPNETALALHAVDYRTGVDLQHLGELARGLSRIEAVVAQRHGVDEEAVEVDADGELRAAPVVDVAAARLHLDLLPVAPLVAIGMLYLDLVSAGDHPTRSGEQQ